MCRFYHKMYIMEDHKNKPDFTLFLMHRFVVFFGLLNLIVLKFIDLDIILMQPMFQRTLTEPTLLLKPFVKNSEEPKDGVWTCPVSVRASADR